MRLRPVSPIGRDAGIRRTTSCTGAAGHRYTAFPESLSKKAVDPAKKPGKMDHRFRSGGSAVPFRALEVGVETQSSCDSRRSLGATLLI